MAYMKAYTAKTKDGFVTALEDMIKHLEGNGHMIKFFQIRFRTNNEMGSSSS